LKNKLKTWLMLSNKDILLLFATHLGGFFIPNTLRKSLQTTSASPYRTQVKLASSFLVCFVIFIKYN
jgi:hypothetical protein